MNYDELEKAQAVPEAASMIETFRAIGYNLETAIADIIDNSISANAKNIYINRVWKGGESYITIKDDGIGMTSPELIQAMRPGAQNPLNERSTTDLGRFGLGLKTASFSQCRKLSVFSKKKNYHSTYWSWDLDYVAQSRQWELIKWIPEEFLKELDDLESGTIVIWSELDRVLPLDTESTDENAKIKFSNSLDKVKKHISMIFHRFIEDKDVKIYWCGHEIEPWNPFCELERKTQLQPLEKIRGDVGMKGFVLPHKNYFSTEEEYKKAEGVLGYPAMQGFYVYRGKRMLLYGDWLGLFRKEEHYKLVRIQIDLPNKLDTEWQIDIKKSKAYPPQICRDQLEAYAKKVRGIGSEVYRHRGKILKQKAGNSFQPLWLEKKKDNKWSFVINREHLMIQNLKDFAKENPEQAIEKLLKFVEEAIPTKTIYLNEAKGEENQATPFSNINIDQIKEVLELMYRNQLKQGKSDYQAKQIIKTQEPFNNYEELIDQLK